MRTLLLTLGGLAGLAVLALALLSVTFPVVDSRSTPDGLERTAPGARERSTRDRDQTRARPSGSQSGRGPGGEWPGGEWSGGDGGRQPSESGGSQEGAERAGGESTARKQARRGEAAAGDSLAGDSLGTDATPDELAAGEVGGISGGGVTRGGASTTTVDNAPGDGAVSPLARLLLEDAAFAEERGVLEVALAIVRYALDWEPESDELQLEYSRLEGELLAKGERSPARSRYRSLRGDAFQENRPALLAEMRRLAATADDPTLARWRWGQVAMLAPTDGQALAACGYVPVTVAVGASSLWVPAEVERLRYGHLAAFSEASQEFEQRLAQFELLETLELGRTERLEVAITPAVGAELESLLAVGSRQPTVVRELLFGTGSSAANVGGMRVVLSSPVDYQTITGSRPQPFSLPRDDVGALPGASVQMITPARAADPGDPPSERAPEVVLSRIVAARTLEQVAPDLPPVLAAAATLVSVDANLGVRTRWLWVDRHLVSRDRTKASSKYFEESLAELLAAPVDELRAWHVARGADLLETLLLHDLARTRMFLTQAGRAGGGSSVQALEQSFDRPAYEVDGLWRWVRLGSHSTRR